MSNAGNVACRRAQYCVVISGGIAKSISKLVIELFPWPVLSRGVVLSYPERCITFPSRRGRGRVRSPETSSFQCCRSPAPGLADRGLADRPLRRKYLTSLLESGSTL